MQQDRSTSTGARGPGRQGAITAARIARIAALNAATRYLEIGVSAGATFLRVDLPFADAVDPAFRFDTAAAARPGRAFHAMPSDDFFRMPGPARVYDIIFLDGLHSFDQTLRDFCATQAYAHDRTVWLIDDTVPSDIFSAVPDEATALRLRRAHGLKGGGWHGDVFKVVFAIHDLFPTFGWRTIRAPGNPQTVVTRGVRADFAPRWPSLEALARTGYADFVEHRDLLNLVPEAEALDWLAGRLARP